MSRPGALQGLARQATGGVDYGITKGEQERLQSATPWRPSLLYKDPTKVDERWSNACARIGRICEGASASSNGVTAPTFETVCRSAAMPRLAHEFLELRFYIATKEKPHRSTNADHNPFRGLSDIEAMAKFRYLIERICDRSTGQFGSWCTK